MEKFNLLVVDDEEIVIESLRRQLRKESSLNFLAALSVEDAMNIMNNEHIHVVLTDLMMPGTDGLEFMKIMKKAGHNPIIIMITGYATISTALQAMEQGAFDYIAKPFTKEEIRKVVRRAIDLVKSSNKAGKQKQNLINFEDEKQIKSIGKFTWMMKQEDGTVLIGAERPFLYRISRIETIYLPSEGDQLRQGSVFFQAFTADFRSESLLSPLSGTVVKVNLKVLESPNDALKDPYGEGWLIRLDPDHFESEIRFMGLG
ncbi:MAG: response regulator [Bacteroidota bacterium]